MGGPSVPLPWPAGAGPAGFNSRKTLKAPPKPFCDPVRASQLENKTRTRLALSISQPQSIFYSPDGGQAHTASPRAALPGSKHGGLGQELGVSTAMLTGRSAWQSRNSLAFP